jgi:hypothetical protein
MKTKQHTNDTNNKRTHKYMAKIISEIIFNFHRLIITITGDPKIGKSTFAAGLGNVLFFCTEPGHKFLKILKWVTDKGEDPTQWEHFLTFAKEVAVDDEVDMVAIDTFDNLYKMCVRHILKKHSIGHESELGYGHGYKLIEEALHAPINYLAQKGKGIIFITHTKTEEKTIKNKKVTYTDTSVPNTGKKIILPLSDMILHATTDEHGKRILVTKGNETLNAGDRSGRLPEVIALDPGAFKKAFEEIRK